MNTNNRKSSIVNRKLTAIGLMSGTSLDGIDAAEIVTDGEKIFNYGKFITIPYEDAFRNRLRNAIIEARAQPIGTEAKIISDKELEHDLTVLHADAVKKLGIKADIIGFHGQTLLHRPDQQFTWQTGDGALLARLTGIETVNDFRTADVLAGGQGAPLVPVFHRAVVDGLAKPVAIVNIGGLANITLVDENNQLFAFDTGPGNAMINDVMKKHFGREFDEDGKIAATGKVNEEVLAKYFEDDFFAKKPPKSLDRNHFNLSLVNDLNPADAVATLTSLTAQTILKAERYIQYPIVKYYICGGGRHNKTLMQMLGNRAVPVEDIGQDGDAFEAQAFGFIAVRVKYNKPITFPKTTGINLNIITNNSLAQTHKIL